MTKAEAIKVLVNFVDDHIVAGGFENDPEYATEIEAIKTLTENQE